MIRTRIKGFLDRHGLYYRLKYSWLFRIYQRLFKHGEIDRQKKEIRFYQSFLPACELVFDVGAYDGHKTAAFLKFTRKVVCIEPDRKNFDILLTRFRNNKTRVSVERKAVTEFAGSAIIHVHHPGSAFNSLAPKWVGILESDNLRRWDEKIAFTSEENIETITLDLLIDKYGRPDFIKIDAEGSEECILRGLSHPVPYLSFETLLPDYHEEFKRCIERIESIGAPVSYNISINEELGLNQFVSKNELENYLRKENIQSSFEVIVKMST